MDFLPPLSFDYFPHFHSRLFPLLYFLLLPYLYFLLFLLFLPFLLFHYFLFQFFVDYPLFFLGTFFSDPLLSKQSKCGNFKINIRISKIDKFTHNVIGSHFSFGRFVPDAIFEFFFQIFFPKTLKKT